MRSLQTGSAGGVLALLGAACPVCIPAIAGALASAGVLITISIILKPLFALLLIIFWFGLWWAYRRHHNIWPFVLGVVFGTGTFFMRYVWYYEFQQGAPWYDWRITVPAAALIGIAYWNYRLDQKCDTCAVAPTHRCSACGLSYKDSNMAKKCQVWCAEHHSCNLEITRHAIK